MQAWLNCEPTIHGMGRSLALTGKRTAQPKKLMCRICQLSVRDDQLLLDALQQVGHAHFECLRDHLQSPQADFLSSLL